MGLDCVFHLRHGLNISSLVFHDSDVINASSRFDITISPYANHTVHNSNCCGVMWPPVFCESNLCFCLESLI